MNIFGYYITTHFITSNKYYNSCRNLHSVYQTYPKYIFDRENQNLSIRKRQYDSKNQLMIF